MHPLAVAVVLGCAVGAAAQDVIRVATFNIEDARAEEVLDPSNARLRGVAETIQRLRPNILLLNELAYDMPGAPGHTPGEPPGLNARRFVDNFLAVPQAPGLSPIAFDVFTAPTNTGVPSGLDLDNNGRVVNTFPILPRSARPTPEALEFAGDCWGFGTFPGQYGMALLVDPRLTILRDKARTFRLLPWDYMPGALLPETPDGPWFDEHERGVARLSSKSHWDVPVRLPSGAVVHILCSHPTPPAFDGPEKRNARRNRDEIRFWRDYIDNAAYIVDDENGTGGLDEYDLFIILGDLNADPDKGDSFKDPLGSVLFMSKRVGSRFVPTSDVEVSGLRPTDTARFGLRVDYVLPSTEIEVLRGGVWRDPPHPSDHFPVWVEVSVPPP